MNPHPPDVFLRLVQSHLPDLPGATSVRIGPHTDLRTCGLDSFRQVQLLLEIEDEYSIEIPDEELTLALFSSPQTIWTAVARCRTTHAGVADSPSGGEAPPTHLKDLLYRAARRNPDVVAVEAGSQALTYHQLDQEVELLAAELRARGVRPGDRIAVDARRCIGTVVAAHAIARAHAVYVPLDPNASVAARRHMATHAAACALVGDSRTIAPLARALPHLVPVAVDPTGQLQSTDGDIALRARSAPRDTHPPRQATPVPPTNLSPDRKGVSAPTDPLAYLFCTSGSAGQPKAAALTHSGALAFAAWAADLVALAPGDRVGSVTGMHVDFSVFDLFSTAAAAATLVLVPDNAVQLSRTLAPTLQRLAVTVCYSIPSLLSRMLEYGRLQPSTLAGLRTIVFAGEPFPPRYLRRLATAAPQARLLNFYGPTETNVCSWHEVRPADLTANTPIPIGTPVPGTRCLIVDQHLRPAPDGTVGELVVQGPTVMREYWADPDRTRAALIALTDDLDAPRAYRTGDMALVGPDGLLHLRGRRDRMVKVNGHRVELDEIEAALAQVDAVLDAAVVAVPDELQTHRLVVFVHAAPGVDPPKLCSDCQRVLPRHALSADFQLVDALPKNGTGKTDRIALAGRVTT